LFQCHFIYPKTQAFTVTAQRLTTLSPVKAQYVSRLAILAERYCEFLQYI